MMRKNSNEFTVRFVAVLSLSSGLLLAGCGGGGNGANAITSGSGSSVENSYGFLTTRATGTAQTPVISTAAGSTVTGIAGASFSSIVQNRSGESLNLSNSKIAFFALDSLGISQIWTIPSGGGVATQITRGGTDKYNPSWSPDGTKIAYQNGQIFTIPATGGVPTQITNTPLFKFFPTWSPDGSKIAYMGFDANTHTQFYTVASTGGTPTQITTGNIVQSWPTWSPDGSLIACDGNDANGYSQIWTIPATGGAMTQISNGNSPKSTPAWSPDGTKLAYQGYDASGKSQIFTMPAQGGTPTQITTGTIQKLYPTWSPDGSKIAYKSQEEGGVGLQEVFAVPSTGGAPTQITTGYGGKNKPVWSPFLNTPVNLVGGDGLLGTGAAGFLFGQSGKALRSFLCFDTGVLTVASRAATRVVNLTPTNSIGPNLVFSITATDSLTKVAYSNYDDAGLPKSSVFVPFNPGTTGAVVSYDANTGMVATVLPYIATKSVGSETAQVRKEEKAIVVNGAFTGIYDASGANHALQGAHTVRLDATTGKFISAQ